MTEDRFWNIVDEFNWGNPNFDHKAHTVRLLHTLSFDEITGLREIFYEKMAQLDAHSGAVTGPSDDGWHDLRAHVIGLGRSEFEASNINPSRMQDRADNYNYRESFAYVLPYTEDIAKLTMGYWSQLAQSYEKEFLSVYSNYDYSENVKGVVRQILAALQKVNAWASKDDIGQAVDEINSLPIDIWSAPWNPVSHGVRNLANDIERFILG